MEEINLDKVPALMLGTDRRLVPKLLAQDAMMCYATKITERAPAESPAERLGACKFLPGQSPLQRILNLNLFGHKCV
jgi:hypothetical protein